ncbi:MAG: Gfo/Idh/MocA family oxidoreductase [Cellvibrionaceae bacterium]
MIKRAAVVGLGSIAARHRANLKILFKDIEIIALSSRGRFIKDKVSDADIIVSDMESLISFSPDFVIIASPSTSHVEHALELLRVNIPLLIEKPVCARNKDIKVLQHAIKESKSLVAVGYCLRFLPSAQVVKDLIVNKAIGKIYNVSSSVGQFLPHWREGVDYHASVSSKKELGGGVLLELSHELDYLQWIFGMLEISYSNIRKSSELEIEVEQIADLILRNKQGVVIYLHQDFIQKKAQRRCSIIGEKGRIDWDLLSNSVSVHRQDSVELIYADQLWDKNNMYLNMINNFIGAVENKENLLCAEIWEAIKIVEMIETIKSNTVWACENDN